MKKITKILLSFFILFCIMISNGNLIFANEYIEANINSNEKDEIIVEIENKSDEILKNLRFNFEFDKNLKLNKEIQSLKNLKPGEKYSFTTKVEKKEQFKSDKSLKNLEHSEKYSFNRKTENIGQYNENTNKKINSLPSTGISFFGYTGVMVTIVILSYLIYKKKSLQKFFVLFVFLFTAIVPNFVNINAEEYNKTVKRTEEFNRVLKLFDEDTNANLTIDFDISISENDSEKSTETHIDTNIVGPVIIPETNKNKIVLVSGMVYDENDALIEEGSFELYQKGEKIKKLELKLDDEGYIYFHVDVNKEYTLKNDKLEARIFAKNDNDIKVDNIKGKFELGKLFKDEVSKVKFMPSTVVVSNFFDYDIDTYKGIVTINQTFEFKSGDVVVLLPSENNFSGSVYRVGNSRIVDGKTIFEIRSLPTIKDTVESLNFNDSVGKDKLLFYPGKYYVKNGIDSEDSTVRFFSPHKLVNGVTKFGKKIYNEATKKFEELTTIKNTANININIDKPENLNFSIPVGDNSLEITLDPDIMKINIDADINFITQKYLLNAKCNIKLMSHLNYEIKKSYNEEFTLGTLVAPLPFGFTIGGDLKVYYDVSGQLTLKVDYGITEDFTFTLENGLSENHKVVFNFDANANANIDSGISVSPNVSWLSFNLLEINAKVGPEFKANGELKYTIEDGFSKSGKIEGYLKCKAEINLGDLTKYVSNKLKLDLLNVDLLKFEYPKEKAKENEVITESGRKELAHKIASDILKDVKKNNPENKADILILLDNSGSMDFKLKGSELTRLEATNEVLKELTKELFEDNSDIRIGLIKYYGQLYSRSKYPSVDFTDSYSELISELPNYGKSGTFTQRALVEAKEKLDESNSRKKILIHITDGVPTNSYVKTENGYDYRKVEDAEDKEKLIKALDGVKYEQNRIINSGINIYNVGMVLVNRDIEDNKVDIVELEKLVKDTYTYSPIKYYDIRDKINIDLEN